MARAPLDHRLIVDRIEGEVVVVELSDGRTLELPRWMLPLDLREGDVIAARVEHEGPHARLETWVDAGETERRRAAAKELVKRLSARDPGGDIEL
jgi:hypothetical protein